MGDSSRHTTLSIQHDTAEALHDLKPRSETWDEFLRREFELGERNPQEQTI